MTSQKPNFYVGIDWATTHHDICLIDQTGEVLHQRQFPNSAKGLSALADFVLELTGTPQNCFVAIESTRGPILDTLLERAFPLFVLNPKQLDRFRDRFSPSGAKDDRRDARVLADSIRTDRRAFRRLEPDLPRIIELREWSRIHEEIQQERVRERNRLEAQLHRYFPQFLELKSGDLAEPWLLELLTQFPTPDHARRRRLPTIKRILTSHRIRRLSPRQVQDVLRQTAVTVAAGTVEAASAHVRQLVGRLKLLNDQLAEAQAQLEALLEEFGEDPEEDRPGKQRDLEIIRGMPGVGVIVTSTLLAEAYRQLDERDYQGIRCASGSAPVTRSTGVVEEGGKRRPKKKPTIFQRRACNKRLSDAVYHWARTACRCDPYWKERFEVLRAKNHSVARIYRSIGNALLRVLVAMLETQTPYQPEKLGKGLAMSKMAA